MPTRHTPPPMPDDFEGCVWSPDGQVRWHYGKVHEDPDLEAQAAAGEEDQTVVWD